VQTTGVTQELRLRTGSLPTVFTPFNADATVTMDGDVSIVSLPEKTSFIILRLPKN
jgi:hypothetical protein